MSVTGHIRSMDTAAGLVNGIGALVLVVALATFLVAPALTGYVAIAFLAFVAVSWFLVQERTARFLLFTTTVSTVLILALITIYLVVKAIPVFRHAGLSLLTGSGEFWNTSTDVYSLVPMMWGTFLTTVIATIVAAPLGVAGAVFISELAPAWAREIIKPAVEMLAGIPSIVYGFIGFQMLNPYFMGALGVPDFASFFVAGVVIGLMALPTVVSVAEDAIASVPDAMKDGAEALGATEWQTTTSVTIPAAFSGVSAGVLLGVGRAIGETMAATVILGNVVRLPGPMTDVFGNGITLTSLIASQYGNASGLHLSALFAAGVVLFITVMALSIGSQLIERRMQRKLGGNA